MVSRVWQRLNFCEDRFFFDLGLGFSWSVGGLIIKTRWVVEVLNDSLKNII